MARIVEWIESIARAIGAPGLFIVAFLDSSFLSLPEINDILVIVAVIQNPELMPYYAFMATSGSVTGCLVLYFFGRRGGNALLRRRFTGPRLERATQRLQRYGVLAVIVPALLPPPAPFKIFILLAGVSHVPLGRFAAAVTIGRGARYFGEGWLAVQYGEQALRLIEEHSRTVSLAVALTVLVLGVAYFATRRARTTAAGG